ncbi:MAG: Rne/Rng family ribonuclease [Rhodobacteraceae bacterium]|nr:Rne/Rng family ribonuclease [Paracoccaceae bacterium]
MANKMLIDATHAEETRVVVVDGSKVEEFDFESENKRQLAGNIYLAKVTRVEPSLQAAFVDYGGNRHGFLAFSEIHPDYYQIPVADREALMAEERAYAQSLRDEDGDEETVKSKPRRSRSRRGKSAETSDDSKADPIDAVDAVLDTDRTASAETADATPPAGIAGMDVVELAPAANPEQSLAEDILGAGLPVTESEVAAEQAEDGADTGEASPDEAATEVETSPDVAVAEEIAATEAAADAPESADGDEEEDKDRPSGGSIAANERLGDDDAVTTSDEDASTKGAAAEPEAVPEAESVETANAPAAEAAPSEPAPEAAAGNDEAASADARTENAHSPSPDEAEAPAEAENADMAASDADEAPEAETSSADGDSEAVDEPAGEAPQDVLQDDSIEAVADDDTPDEIRPPRKPRPRRYKIQEVVKVRQIMLVQVVKEERGNKGAALTTYLSLAGRYCVLMPNTARGGGISRKITNAVDRKKLKQIAAEIDVPDGAGLIIRTAGAKRTKSEIKRDYEYLQRLWEQIRELTLQSIAPTKIYEEGDLIKRSIRDLYTREIDEVLVEGEAGYRTAKDFMKMIMPSHAKNVKQYTDPLPLFARFQVESYLGAMFNPTVKLKSGGYIVIGVTEALVAIDVNSGKATKEGSIEQTALNTNLEAAEEIARQLRLRDLAGLIVIDFIDMEERKNNAAVEKRFKDKLKNDRARIQVGRISGFGLLEMSRQRLRPGMIEATTKPCSTCHGTGLIRSDDNLALNILREVEEEGVRRRSREVLIAAPIGIANFLMNNKREHIAQIETRYGLSIRIEADPHLISPDFRIEKFKTATRKVEATAPVVSVDTTAFMPDLEEIEAEEVEAQDTAAPPEVEADSESDEGQGGGRKRRRRRRRRKSGGNGGDEATGVSSEAGDPQEADAATGDSSDSVEASNEDGAEGSEAQPRRRRSRGGRGRRRNGDNTGDTAKGRDASEEESAGTAQNGAVVAAAEGVAFSEVGAEPAAEADETPGPLVAEAPAEQASDDEQGAAAEMPEPSADAPEPATQAEDIPHAEPEATEAALADEAAEAIEPAADAFDAPAAREEIAPKAAPEEAAKPAEPPKPKRRGWWSMGA